MKQQTWRMVTACFMVVGMMGCSIILKEKEIIFPEIAALVIGAWVLDDQPWKVNRIRMFFLMSISALVGIVIVRYIELMLYAQIMLGLFFAFVSLILSKTTMVPMISACILPILMQTTTFLYPLSVSVMCLLILLIQMIMEKQKIRQPIVYEKYHLDKEECFLWMLRFLFLGAYVWMAIQLRAVYLIAPPLFVTFVEISFSQSHVRKNYKKVVRVMICASLIGFACRYLQIALAASALGFSVLSFGMILFFMREQRCFFPPAGAISLLPFILPYEGLEHYPLLVSLSTILLVICAMYLPQLAKSLLAYQKDDL